MQRQLLILLAAAASGGVGLSAAAAIYVAAGNPLPTTPADFQQPGTQPLGINAPIQTSLSCLQCHGGYDEVVEPGTRWQHSMMGQSARDPIFHAALAIAEQDAPGSGDLCIRCHSPGGWLEGRGTPSDGSALTGKDFEGVSCHVCHRMVDPVASPANPPEDASILAGLGANLPTNPHSGQLVVDPEDRRRGPFQLPIFFSWHSWLESPYHQESRLCATCHDVSNPALERVGGPTPSAADTYAIGTPGAPHPTHDKFDQFPIERTFSEWEQSAFAQGPVEMGGKFGGNKTAVSSCQDCHMPDTSGEACAPGYGGEFRTDLPQHDFNGANSWVLKAILDLDQSHKLYGPSEVSGMNPAEVDKAIARNVSMLQRAAELVVGVAGESLNVRVVNDTGHKLPTGYGEGRRMWLNVRFLDAAGAVVAEHGSYDAATAVLTTADTKVYEIQHGLDAAMSTASGQPQGKSFHFVLNNTIEKDNRIPPRGFTNAGFEAVQAQVVGATYADGQYWDDTPFSIPCGAVEARVRLYHQTTTKEYIEFLRDENTTNDRGQIAYDLWVAHGMSEPVLMQERALPIGPSLAADVPSISVQAGGQQALCITADPTLAGKLYWVVGSTSGTSPGFVFEALQVPLNFDEYTQHTLLAPNQAPLLGTIGVLDGVGAATAAFVLPPGLNLPGLPGNSAHHVAVVLDTAPPFGVAVSNPVELAFLP